MPENEYCIAVTFLGEPCTNTAEIGDYCVIHADGWAHTKANMAMLWSVYSRVQAIKGALGVVIPLSGHTLLAPSTPMANPSNVIDLGTLENKANDLLARLDSLAGHEGAQQAIEEMGPEIIALHRDFHSLIRVFALSNQPYRVQVVSVKQASVRQEAEAQSD